MTDTRIAAQRQGALRSLIGLGKSRGYLLRAEDFERLREDWIDKQQIDDIVEMIRDMGIPVVDEPPTAAELAALTAPGPRSTMGPTPVPAAVHPAGCTPIRPPLVVLKVSGEGGAIRPIAQELTTGWRYRSSMLDQSLLWLDEGDSEIRRQSEWVYEWSDALTSLDRYPWAALHPIEVHRDFADRIMDAVRDRLARPELALQADRRLPEWSALCHG